MREVLLGLSARSLALVRRGKYSMPPSAVGAAGLPPNLRRPTLLALHFCWQFHHPPFCSRPHLSFLANTPPSSYHSSETSPGPLPFGISSNKNGKIPLPPSINNNFIFPPSIRIGDWHATTYNKDAGYTSINQIKRPEDEWCNNKQQIKEQLIGLEKYCAAIFSNFFWWGVAQY